MVVAHESALSIPRTVVAERKGARHSSRFVYWPPEAPEIIEGRAGLKECMSNDCCREKRAREGKWEKKKETDDQCRGTASGRLASQPIVKADARCTSNAMQRRRPLVVRVRALVSGAGPGPRNK